MLKCDILIQHYNTDVILKFSKHINGFLFLLTLRDGPIRLRPLLKFQHPECMYNTNFIYSHEKPLASYQKKPTEHEV
jgi:hypothetical protein